MLRIEGEIVSNPQKLADVFNDIFLKKVQNLIQKTHNPVDIDPGDRLKAWLNLREEPLPQFKLKPISLDNLRKIMAKVKGSRTHGDDFIDSFSIKLAFPLIEDAVLHLVNLSIATQSFADRWKVQLVFPLHKKSDKLIGENYRPVSHIIEIGKIVEYAIYEQVYNHFVLHNLFHGNHHGFLGNHSTATALAHLHDIWLEASEDKKLSAALLLDLSAAFDVVDHAIFLRKLEIYNFSEETVSWFKSYLTGRKQCVQVQ